MKQKKCRVSRVEGRGSEKRVSSGERITPSLDTRLSILVSFVSHERRTDPWQLQIL
jgi:hypothetical protein